MQIFETFISYRRSETLAEVQNIYHALTTRGYSTFCDIYSLSAGRFNDNLKRMIQTCTNYILVLGEHSLDRCTDNEDWLKFEISTALASHKNIICVFVGNVTFPSVLPDEINEIRFYTGLRYDFEYYNGFIDCLTSRFLISQRETELSNETRDFLIEDQVLIKYLGDAPIVSIPQGIKQIGSFAFKDKTQIIDITFPPSLQIIGESAFERCINITHLIFPESLQIIGEAAFRRCYGLSFIAFDSCLERIEKEAFCFCTNLKIARLGEKLSFISSDVFNNCDKLCSITVEEDNEYYEAHDGILYDKPLKTLIRCPEGYQQDLVEILPSVRILKEWCFSRCTGLIDVILPRHLQAIKAHAFSDCCNISSLTVGDEVTEFDVSALDGWREGQRIIVSKRFNPLLKYNLDKKIAESSNIIISPEKDLPKYVMVKTTFESAEEASKMARMLIDNRFIASAQLNKLNVFYTWNNEPCNENEIELSCITKGSLYYTVEEFIKSHHSYECCQIICLPIIATSDEFGSWINSLTKD